MQGVGRKRPHSPWKRVGSANYEQREVQEGWPSCCGAQADMLIGSAPGFARQCGLPRRNWRCKGDFIRHGNIDIGWPARG
jgi:hypothetical protein